MGNLCTHLKSTNRVAPLEAKLCAAENIISSQGRTIAHNNNAIASQNRTILSHASEISNLKKLIASQTEDLTAARLAKAMAIQQARDLDQMLADAQNRTIARLIDLEKNLK